jgi:CRP-like cAMP-binding protein
MPDRIPLSANQSQVRNRILLALPEDEYQRISRHLAFVELRQGQVLYNTDNWIDYAYFMNSGMASSVSVNAEGQTIEDGIVGQEGLMGGPAALGEDQIFCSGVVQIPGNAMRIGTQVLKYEFKHNAGFSKLLLDYMNDLHRQHVLSGECIVLHPLEQRLCRLLLQCEDCAPSSSFPFTYEFLSHMVRSTREAVSLIMDALHEAGLILCRRRNIRIVNREEMEHRACSCYQKPAHQCFRREAEAVSSARLGRPGIALSAIPHVVLKKACT